MNNHIALIEMQREAVLSISPITLIAAVLRIFLVPLSDKSSPKLSIRGQ